MAYTYSKLATVTVGSGGSSSIDFIAIPQNYTDLLILASIRENQNAWAFWLEFNSTTANRSQRQLVGNGSTVSSNSSSTEIFAGATATTGTASTFGNTSIYIPNYTVGNFKSVSVDGVSESNQTTAYAAIGAGLWSNTAPITSLKLAAASGGLLSQYSTATLYGIKAEV